MKSTKMGFARARAACLSCALGVTLLAGRADAEGAKAGSMGPPAAPFGEWTALGSGCKGGPSGGDGAAAIFRDGTAREWRARFHMDSFHLSTDERPAGAPLTFARECGVRIAIVPPPRTRVALVAAETRFVARKPIGAKLTLSADLRLGAAPIASRVVTYAAAEDRRGEEPFVLAPGMSGPMPPTECGERRVAALDLTWIVRRDAASQSARVAMAAERTADIVVRFEPC